MSLEQSHIRVLQVIGAMNRAGAETMLMNLHETIDHTRIHFDYLVHTNERCDYDDRIRELGGTIYSLPEFRVTNFRSYRKAAAAFFDKQASNYDIVHGHIGSSAPIYLDEARKRGCTTVAHSHNTSPLTGLRQAAYRALSRPVINVADEFLACSRQAGIDRFGEAVVNGAHFHVLNNAIRINDFACTDAQHTQAKASLGCENVPVVVHVGRFARQKNHAFLIDAFATLLQRMPNAQLFLLGTGPLEQNTKDKAQHLGIAEAVHFEGLRTDVARYLRAADVFIFPSILEGLGMAVVEAQAAGAPCVASSAIPDEAILTDTIVRLDLGNPEEWAAAMTQAIEHPQPRNNGAEQVAQGGYAIEGSAQWLAAFYQKLAQARKGAQ